MTAIIAAPLCIISLVIIAVVFYIKRRQDQRRPYRPGGAGNPEEDRSFLPEEETIGGMIDEWSNSGSGSGK